MPRLSRDRLLGSLPPVPPVSAGDVVRAQEASGMRPVYVVLDDDPTGTQSVAGLPVLTSWEVGDFAWAFETGAPAVYVMTNSRSLAPEDAERVNREAVAAAVGVDVAFVSRSDSTLRGHFPLEPNTIAECLRSATGARADGIVVVPAFGDAGRITVHGTHYAGDPQEGYLPVGETEFARDATFGYAASNLAEWVEEKTGGAVPASDVLVLDIETLRTDLDGAVALLTSARDARPIVVDAVEEEDVAGDGLEERADDDGDGRVVDDGLVGREDAGNPGRGDRQSDADGDAEADAPAREGAQEWAHSAALSGAGRESGERLGGDCERVEHVGGERPQGPHDLVGSQGLGGDRRDRAQGREEGDAQREGAHE